MPRRVEEAEGITFELGDYIDTGIGSLSNRLLDVEMLFWGKVTTDSTLDSFPDPGKIDPQLWDVATSSLEWVVEGASHSRHEKAGDLVREVRERKRKFKLREKQRRCRASKKQKQVQVQGTDPVPAEARAAELAETKERLQKLETQVDNLLAAEATATPTATPAEQGPPPSCAHVPPGATEVEAMAGGRVGAPTPVAEGKGGAAGASVAARGEAVPCAATRVATPDSEAAAGAETLMGLATALRQQQGPEATTDGAGLQQQLSDQLVDIIDPVQELADLNITEEESREAVETLRNTILAAHKHGDIGAEHDSVKAAIDDFCRTPFGQQARRWLHQRGWALVPLFSGEDVSEKTSAMVNAVEKRLLHDQGGQFVVPQNFSAPRIRSQTRYMIDPTNERKLGHEFVGSSKEMAETMAFVLQALDYGCHIEVEVEKLTLLLSAARGGVQILHKDQPGKEVLDRMEGMGSGSRSRKEPPPYSALCAFQGGTTLHVIDGSHKKLEQDEFSWEDAKELKIPRGWGLLFHSCLVHAGVSYKLVNGRLHLYLKVKGGLATFEGKLRPVVNVGEPPV